MHKILAYSLSYTSLSFIVIHLIFHLSLAQTFPNNSSISSLKTADSLIQNRDHTSEYGDLDGDGVFNKYDLCVNEMGPVENDGCPVEVSLSPGPYSDGFYGSYLPYADPDRDGVPNIEDSCKFEAGLVAYHGCIPKELSSSSNKATLLNRYTLHYNVGSSIIKTEARKQLNHALADLLRNPKSNVLIVPYISSSQHIDLSFSERRAIVIREYLIQKQIQTNRIQILPTKSIDNLEVPYVDLLIERTK